MNIKEINLKNKAVLIADVHYKKGDIDFLNLLKNWNKNPPPQIFFLGDIFHLLLPFKFLIEYNKEAIDLINELSKKTEVFYTSGNHDFNIEKIFKNVTFADAFVDKEKSIFLTHGDLTDKDLFYKFYVLIIRNYLGNKILNFVTLNFLNNWLFKKILQKSIRCSKITKFDMNIKNKIADINYNNIIEGHYHQNVFFDFNKKSYLNIGAFFCDKIFFVYEDFIIKETNGNRGQNIKGRLKRA